MVHSNYHKSHLVEEIINHVGLKVSETLKSGEAPAGKPLLHKDEYSLVRKSVWSYREVVGLLSFLQGST